MPVPKILQPPSLKYAGYEGPWFEEYFLRNCEACESTGASYVPLLWDNFFAQAQSHNYWPGEFARRFRAMWHLLSRLGTEDRAFFTVLGIYDFPIWNWHLFPENIVVLAANGYGDVPLPLLKGDRPFASRPKDMRLSFLGRTDTHPLRQRMREVFADDAVFYEGPDWEQMMARSALSLCPRGLGPASFRMYEALSLGSVPVYLWEKRKWLPFEDSLDWSKIAVVAEASEMQAVRARLERMSDMEIAVMRSEIARVYDTHFRYEGVARRVCDKVSSLRTRQEAKAVTSARKDFVY